MTNDYNKRAEYEENFQYAKNFWAPYIEASRIYTKAAAGTTWSDVERRELMKEGREPLEFNIMRRPLQFYSGYLRDNLNSILIVPRENSDPKTADQLTKVSSTIWDKGSGYSCFLDSCDEAGKSGMSLTGIELNYNDDFINGDLQFYKRTNNSFYLDPLFENIDLRDCGFAITRDLLSRKSAQSLLQYIGQDVINEVPVGFRDNKFIDFHPQFSNFSQNRDIIAYDQYYCRTSRLRKFLIDEEAGYYRDVTDLSDLEMEKLHTAIRRMQTIRDEASLNGGNPNEYPVLQIKSIERDFIELNVFLNGIQFYSGEDKTGITETYPFVPNLCYFEPSLWDPAERVQGFPATMYSMQRQFNKRHMKIIDMMDSEISTGFKYLIGSVPDVKDMLQAGQMKLIGVDPDNAPQGLDSVQELRGGGANPTLIEYQRILDELSLTLANVNETVLGIDQDSKTIISGRLAQVRLAQGLRTNRKYFDNVEVSQTLLAKLVLWGIQKNYPPEKVKRLIGEEPTEQFYEHEFEKYDAILKQGLRSQSQKDNYYNELVNLKREGIVDVPSHKIVDALQITGMSDLEEIMAAQDKQAQEQQQKINIQEEVALQLANAKTEEALALAVERRARVEADLALAQERISEAHQNRSQAALDRAKTITEISNLEDERLLRVVEFVNQLEQEEVIDREMVGNTVTQKTRQIENDVESSAAELGTATALENADDQPQMGG